MRVVNGVPKHGMQRVLVLGGSGFVGRHAVVALVADGADVVIRTRTPGNFSGEERIRISGRRLDPRAAVCALLRSRTLHAALVRALGAAATGQRAATESPA